MKFLFISDSFKGTLSSAQTGALLTKAAREIFPDCDCRYVPVADGGEGTTDAVIAASGGEKIGVQVSGPLGEPVQACYGKLDAARAVLEMAAASGLTLIPEEKRNPLKTTTYGTGELIRAILDGGFTDISIAIGGSATNDGGMGCMRALGVRFLDGNGKELEGVGADLGKVRHVDVSGLDPRVKDTKFTVMCDVTNPLCGPDGAAYTFGPQKGGTPDVLAKLEDGMENYRDVLEMELGLSVGNLPGAGAAGGLGAALMAFLNAERRSGIEAVLDLIGFDDLLRGVSLVVTGEGRCDRQSCFGKVIQGVGCRCQKHGVPAAALVGSLGEGAEDIYQYGICALMTTVSDVMSLKEAMDRAEELYYDAALRMFRLIRTGRLLS